MSCKVMVQSHAPRRTSSAIQRKSPKFTSPLPRRKRSRTSKKARRVKRTSPVGSLQAHGLLRRLLRTTCLPGYLRNVNLSHDGIPRGVPRPRAVTPQSAVVPPPSQVLHFGSSRRWHHLSCLPALPLLAQFAVPVLVLT